MSPAWVVFFAIRLLRSRETREGLAQRLGRAPHSQTSAQTIWVHGASIGELTAARSFLQSLLDRSPDLQLIVTMNSYSSREMVHQWNMPRVRAVLAPLDYALFVHRFLASWTPDMMISLENEMWPNRIRICQQQTIPVIILGGRLSTNAARLWARFPGLAKSVFGSICAVAPQDNESAIRFADLGVPAEKIGAVLNLKSGVTLAPADPATRAKVAQHFDYGETIIAASTHDQEDQIMLDALVLARNTRPNLSMVIVPRHPQRADDIMSLARARDLISARWSTGGLPKVLDVLIADTLGEMALWYATGHVTVIGGTFANKGGHTPFEPAQFSSAIVHGPSVFNHASAFEALSRGNGALLATDAETLAAAIVELGDEGYREAMISTAKTALATQENDAQAMNWLYAEIATQMQNSAFSAGIGQKPR